MQKITRQLANEIKISEAQVRSAVELLDGGATVPFIARDLFAITGNKRHGGATVQQLDGGAHLGFRDFDFVGELPSDFLHVR